MAKLERAENVTRLLRQLYAKAARHRYVSVVVGYTQNYALWVHETDRNYRVGGWKYLQRAATALRTTLPAIVRQAMRSKAGLEQGLLLAGLRLQRDSQTNTPVDTSALKASAFTALEKDAGSAAADARAQSDAIRADVIKTRQQVAG